MEGTNMADSPGMAAQDAVSAREWEGKAKAGKGQRSTKWPGDTESMAGRTGTPEALASGAGEAGGFQVSQRYAPSPADTGRR